MTDERKWHKQWNRIESKFKKRRRPISAVKRSLRILHKKQKKQDVKNWIQHFSDFKNAVTCDVFSRVHTTSLKDENKVERY